MRLLLKRTIKENASFFGRVDLVLWAQFELTAEERALIRKYKIDDTYLTIEGSWHAYRRACLYAIVPALIFAYLIDSWAGFTLAFFALIASFLLISWIIYEQIREAIKVTDILGGRQFKNKSVILHIRRERNLLGYAVAFKNLLEILKTWEGTDVVELGEEHESALRLVSDTYAPA